MKTISLFACLCFSVGLSAQMDSARVTIIVENIRTKASVLEAGKMQLVDINHKVISTTEVLIKNHGGIICTVPTSQVIPVDYDLLDKLMLGSEIRVYGSHSFGRCSKCY